MSKKERGKTKIKREVLLLHLARMGEMALETLLELGLGLGEIAIALMGTTSRKQSMYYLWEATRKQKNVHIDLQSKIAFSTMLSRLKKEGLIEQREGRVKLTNKGSAIANSSKLIPLTPLPNEKSVLVIFDIPEKVSKKRMWIREELKKMGFEMMQKSVWKGNTAIPKEFLKDIYNLKLKEYVHIFEVTKYGTLE